MTTTARNVQKASFGMSWFWFPEAQFGCASGILRTRVGFAGGSKENPTYRSLGDHTETVLLEYDADQTSYSDLLDIFWANHDPTVMCSRQYMSAIFYHSDQQKALAEKSMAESQNKFRKQITTLILPAEEFYDAEKYENCCWSLCRVFQKNILDTLYRLSKKGIVQSTNWLSNHNFSIKLISYHQKYLLRKHEWLLNALNLTDDEELKRSHVAARINGYIGGYGDEASFELERTRLNLNEEVFDYVLEEIRSKQR